jgi:hypothetical protein
MSNNAVEHLVEYARAGASSSQVATRLGDLREIISGLIGKGLINGEENTVPSTLGRGIWEVTIEPGKSGPLPAVLQPCTRASSS